MKVLGIVAGRHNGNSEILVKEALLACQEAGAECKMINLFDYHIEHCTGCEACTMQMGDVAMGKGTYKGCILKDKDDMDKMDKNKIDIIYSEEFPVSGVGRAIMNRLLKSAGYKIIRA